MLQKIQQTGISDYPNNFFFNSFKMIDNKCVKINDNSLKNSMKKISKKYKFKSSHVNDEMYF